MTMGILIMARAPRPGQVKTRLEPLLGADGCAGLQAELVRHTTEWVDGCAEAAWLAFTPADAHQEMAELTPPSIRLFPQEGEDLGQRLRHASALVFARHSGALAVIGADAPQLSAAHARCAERALRDGHDVSVIPALDGGYALIASARPAPGAFDLPSEAWGGPNVLRLTLAALREGGYSVAVLRPVRDLDTPQDARYMAADPRCPRAISHVLHERMAA